MADIRIAELPVATDLEKTPGEDDILLFYDTSTRITADVLLRSMSVRTLLEYVESRLEERRR